MSGFTDPSFFPFFTGFAFAMVFNLLRIFSFLLPTLLLVQSIRQTAKRMAKIKRADLKVLIGVKSLLPRALNIEGV